MKRVIINSNEITSQALSPLYYGYCNAIATKDLERMRKEANLEIVCPSDNPTYEYHYFFDIRDCNNEDYRPSGKTEEEVLNFVEKELYDLQDRLKGVLSITAFGENMSEAAYLGLENKIESLCKRLDKVAEEVGDLALSF